MNNHINSNDTLGIPKVEYYTHQHNTEQNNTHVGDQLYLFQCGKRRHFIDCNLLFVVYAISLVAKKMYVCV